MSTLSVTVRTKQGSSHALTLPASANLALLRASIAKEGIAPVAGQILIFKGSRLTGDNKPLSSFGITNGATIALSSASTATPSSSTSSSASNPAAAAQVQWLRDVPEADRARWARAIAADQEIQFSEAQKNVSAAHAFAKDAIPGFPEASQPAPDVTRLVRASNSIPPSGLHPMYPLSRPPCPTYLAGDAANAAAKDHAEWSRMRAGAADAVAASDEEAASATVAARASNDVSKLLERILTAALAANDAQARRKGSKEAYAATAAGAAGAGLLGAFARALAHDAKQAQEALWA